MLWGEQAGTTNLHLVTSWTLLVSLFAAAIWSRLAECSTPASAPACPAMPGARSGGYKRRRASELASEGRPAGAPSARGPELSPLASSLLDKWAWGVISAPIVQ